MISKCYRTNTPECKAAKARVAWGFTLVELLIVIAIIGVLAAIIIPNLSGLVGSGQDETLAAELTLVQSAVDTMMVKKGLTTLTATTATNDMSQFPANNPLYPNYLRTAATKGYYSCTATGLVAQTGQSGTSSPTITSSPTVTTPAYPAWSTSTIYQTGANVSYNGGKFTARSYAAAGQTPGVLANPWQEITNQWRSFNIYNSGDQVSYSGGEYLTRNWTQNQTPGLLSSPWQEITNQWQSFNIYNAGHTVSYNGSQFQARYWTQNQIPGLIASPWQEITDQWRSFNIYDTSDLVMYSGHQYQAKYYSQNSQPDVSAAWQMVE